MTQRLCESYRGFDLLIEAVDTVCADGRHVRVHRTITRQLGERTLSVATRGETTPCSARLSQQALADALRDAREAVDRLLGGWHPAYSQAPAFEKASAH